MNLIYIFIVCFISLKSATLTKLKPNIITNILANVLKENSVVCGGVFYRENLIITTATYVKINPIYLSVGLVTSNETTPVDQVYFHPQHDWNQVSYYNLALLRLDVSNNIRTNIVLDTVCKSNSLELSEYFGWGEEPFKPGRYKTIFQNITLPIIPISKCKLLHRNSIDPKTELCAGHAYRNNRAAYMFYGNPLVTINNNEITLVGVSSRTYSALLNPYDSAPVIFTRICSVSDFIIHTDHLILKPDSAQNNRVTSGW